MAMIKARNPGENEFHQAVQEVAESLIPFIEENPSTSMQKFSRGSQNRNEQSSSGYPGSMTKGRFR